MSTDSLGRYSNGNRWNTRSGDKIVNLYVIASSMRDAFVSTLFTWLLTATRI